MAQQVNPEAVIARLAAQLGQLAAEMAMRDVALDEAQKRITDLEAAVTAQVAEDVRPEAFAPQH